MASSLSALQFDAALKQQPPAPLYLIMGEEDLLRDGALASLRGAVFGNGGEDFNLDQFYGDEAHGTEIVNCASEMPVFAQRRLVIVKSAEKLPARETEALISYLKEPVQSTTVAFMSQKLDGRLKFSQALARAAVMIDCSPLRDAQLTPWILREAQRLNMRLEEQAAQQLKEVSGGALYTVRRELEKLACYVTGDRPVTAADVQVLRGIEPGASVFDLTLAIGDADRARALTILVRNLEAGEAPLRILGSLAWQYRRLWKVKESLRAGAREAEAARTLRMDPMKTRAFLAQFSDAHLQGALQLFLETDGHLKGGSSGHPRIVMERLLLRLCEYVRPRTPPSGNRPMTPPSRSQARVLSNVRTIKSGNRTGR